MSNGETERAVSFDGVAEATAGERPTWAEINLDALAANFQAVRGRVAAGVRVMAVVKADAYGHGAARCARRLAREGADWFGVALPEEGIELRRAGIEQPILSLGGCWPGQERVCIQHAIVPVVYRVETAEALDRAAEAAGVRADIHVKIDTGMGRLGVRYDEAREFVDALRRFKNLRLDGVMTHFAAADDPERDCFTGEQTARFHNAVEMIRELGFQPSYQDMANSAATFAHPSAWGNMVRPGGVLYGLWRDVLPQLDEPPRLRPVMAVRSRIAFLKRVPQGETLGYGCTFEAARETLVATLPIGYNDGYARALSNRGRVIVGGVYAPVVGRISMDLTLIDVTDVPRVAVGDRVTLLGEDGSLAMTAEEIAKTVGTLSYEITCGISRRVPRRYAPDEDG
ncbi:MAG: alanine racemase [Blastocatellia bacterium]|jgi:alanine racemase|nr:alanine racemase [Blastocatellia bacterium]